MLLLMHKPLKRDLSIRLSSAFFICNATESILQRRKIFNLKKQTKTLLKVTVHNRDESSKASESCQNLVPLQMQKIQQQKCATVILCILGNHSLPKQLKPAKKHVKPFCLTKENTSCANPKSSTTHESGFRQISQ